MWGEKSYWLLEVVLSKLILLWVLHDVVLIVLLCLFPPAEKPAAEQNTQPSRLSASSSSSDSSSSSSSSSSSDTSDSDSGWEAGGFPYERGPGSFASHQVDWTAVELLTMEPQDGSEETSTRQNWSASTSVKERERDGAFPVLSSFIQSCPGHRKAEDGWKEGDLLPFSGELAVLGSARDAPSPARKRRWAKHVLEG